MSWIAGGIVIFILWLTFTCFFPRIGLLVLIGAVTIFVIAKVGLIPGILAGVALFLIITRLFFSRTPEEVERDERHEAEQKYHGD